MHNHQTEMGSMTLQDAAACAFSGAEDLHERRRKPRIPGPIPATLRGEDSQGGHFEIDVILDNLSAGGLYVRLDRQIEGRLLLASFLLPAAPTLRMVGTNWVAVGIVRRVEPQPGGTCGIGVEFMAYREI